MPNVFNFSDEEFLNVVNRICSDESPVGDEYIPMASMEESLVMDRLDSLGVMMFFIWLSELFGISDKLIEEFIAKELFTLRAVKIFVTEHATRTYDYSEAEQMEPQ